MLLLLFMLLFYGCSCAAVVEDSSPSSLCQFLFLLYVFLRFSRFRHFSRAVVIRQIWGRKRREEKRRKAQLSSLTSIYGIIECEESSQEVIIISVQLARNVKAYGGKFLEKGKDICGRNG